MNMKKVKNIYLAEKGEELGSTCATGLILELEDGTFLNHQSTDVIMPFEPMSNPPAITLSLPNKS